MDALRKPDVAGGAATAVGGGCFVLDGEDDLLNFSLDVGGEEEKENKNPSPFLKDPYSFPPLPSSTLISQNQDDDLSRSSSFPEFVEEELEWLSNKDAFPTLETCFDLLPEALDFDGSNHQSPVSVLENSSSSSNSNGSNNGNGTAVMSCCENLKVPTSFPVRPRSQTRRRKRTSGFGDLPCQGWQWWNHVNIKNNRRELALPPVPVKANSNATIGRRCLHCQADQTPQWRAGPMGPKTLCNACGVRYKSGRLVPEYRPACSPTFLAAVHSNSHRKIVEMRRLKELGSGATMENGSCGYRLLPSSQRRRRKRRSGFGHANIKSNRQELASTPVLVKANSSATVGRKCLHSQADHTLKWRAGPMGPKTLCSACGLQYMSGSLVSEYCTASSPTISQGLGSPPVPLKANSSATIGKRCLHCQDDQTCQWHAGPMGPKTLCNSCRLRYMSGRLVSEYGPASSPTISQESASTPVPVKADSSATIGRRCQHCQVDQSRQWRAGPMGPKTLCNACGVRYKLGHLVPKYHSDSSPTYSQELASPPAPVKANSSATIGKRCLHCQADQTPLWRAGPMGPRTLCNACGMRYKTGRLLPEYRPASSPTFLAAVHSNRHRIVSEIRRQNQLGSGGIMVNDG